MKTIIKLTQEDIASILAKHFNVDTTKVDLECGTTTAGYGMQEYEVGYVRAEIEVENK